MSATKELRAMLDSHGVEVRLHKPVTKAELARENAELRDEMSWLRAQLDEDEHELSMAADREVHAARREAELREELDAAKHDLQVFSENLARLGAENAKLKEERDHWRVEQVHAYGNWQDAHKRATELESKNVKLRELVRDYDHCTMHADCSRCEYDDNLSTHCPLSPCFPDADELYELGVEVEW